MAVAGSYASLAEAQAATRTDDLIAGLVNEIVREGGILDLIPTRTVRGVNLAYVRENIQPSGGFHAIADTWTASEDIDVTKITMTLAIHGDEKDIDNFVAKTYSDPNDHTAVIMAQTMRGLKNRIERAIIYESTAFSGLHSLVTSNQTLSQGSGSTEAAATVTNLNRMLDLVRPKADVLLVPYRLGQRFDQTEQGVNSSALTYAMASEGMRKGHLTGFWRDVKIRRSDYMATANTGVFQETIASGVYSAETGGASASAFGVHWGLPENGEVGGVFLAIGEELFSVEGPHPHQTKDARWVRVTSYLATGLAGTRGLGIMDGCSDAALTA